MHSRAPRIFLLPKGDARAALPEVDSKPLQVMAKPAAKPGTCAAELVAPREASVSPCDATVPEVSAGLRKSLRAARRPVDIAPSVLPASLAEVEAARAAHGAAAPHDYRGLLNDLASLDGVFDDIRSAEAFSMADLSDIDSAAEWDRLGEVADEIGREIAAALRALG